MANIARQRTKPNPINPEGSVKHQDWNKREQTKTSSSYLQNRISVGLEPLLRSNFLLNFRFSLTQNNAMNCGFHFLPLRIRGSFNMDFPK
jgi:hypothetical protein